MNRPISRLAKPWALEGALSLAGLLFGAVSLTYPFGCDQGLYAYVAREWVQHGRVPYRDVFDHKTPGIYAIHALTTILFGSNEWGIRVAEMACVLALGVISARLVTARNRPVRPGLRGLTVIIASILYFGFFDYWSAGQSEIWYGTLGVAAVAAVLCIEREPRAQMVAGALSGLAVLIKPPAIWMVLLALGFLYARVRESEGSTAKRLALGLLRFGMPAIAILLATFGYFAAKGALPAMFDIVVGANGYYVKHEKGVDSVTDAIGRLLSFYADLAPVATFLAFGLVIALAVAIHTQDRRLALRYARPALLIAAAVAAVGMQLKFYVLHYAVIIPPLVVLGATLVDDLLAWLETRISRVASLAACAVSLFALYLSTNAPWFGRRMWWHANERAYAWLTGAITREQYTHDFNIPMFTFDYGDIDAVGRYIELHSTPDETICVRGFNPGVYIVAHRSYGGRFFWTNFLTDPRRAYRRAEYLEEDHEAFVRTKPRYVVTLTKDHEGVDASETYLPLGYHLVSVFGGLTLLERGAPAS